MLNEAEIIDLILQSQIDEGADAPKLQDDERTLSLARELHHRLGHDMVSQLIESSWPTLRKHLRDTIEKAEPHRSAPLAGPSIVEERGA